MSSHTLWYATRATGIVALVLLTVTTVLGVVTSVRFATPEWPRFTWQDLHRRLSLVAVVFVGLHVASTILDGYAPIGWLSAVVPFTSPYRRLWLGLGTVAVDLLLAVGITSALRSRLKPVTWRAVHWLAYVSWPVAVVHALGTGTDPRLHWVLGLVVVCAGALLGAVAWRLTAGWPRHRSLRVGAGAVGAVSLVSVAAWTASGPLRPGWAARAGTPASLLGRTVAAPPASGTGSGSGATATQGAGALPAPPYLATLTGTITDRPVGAGLAEVDISTTATGTASGVLGIRLVGTPDGNGGLVMQRGSADFGPSSAPTQYRGSVVGLDGTRLVLAVSDGTGHSLHLDVRLTIEGTAVHGVLQATSAAAGAGTGAGTGEPGEPGGDR